MANVSVVIPTARRRELFRAIQSALNQTYPVHEVLIVADTVNDIELPDDRRVMLLRIGPGAGGNAARQKGILQTTGDTIALLDDDNEWFPNKTEVQLAMVEAHGYHGLEWVASCRVEAHGLPEGVAVWPEATMLPTDSLVDYLFRKTKVPGGLYAVVLSNVSTRTGSANSL